MSAVLLAALGANGGVAGTRRDDAVSLADLAPTILFAAGVTPPDAMKGRNLLESVRSDGLRAAPSGVEGRLKPDVPRSGLPPDGYAETEYPHVAGWSAAAAKLLAALGAAR